jgi:hypothetical protein
MAQSYRIHIELSLPATLPQGLGPADFPHADEDAFKRLLFPVTGFDSRATRNLLTATMLSPPDLRIRSRPNRTSPEEFGVAPEQSILRLP